MSRRSKTPSAGVMLDLWRPPKGAGEAVGCLSSTYTFAPGLFDEQCLARFLEIESEPNREDLAFLLEREDRLGPVYAGVLVDHTQSGVEHSYRWDVLPVSIRAGKQHAKLSLLVWNRHARIIVASANLTEQGYRSNHEVAGSLDLSPDGGSMDALEEAIRFLRDLVRLVPGASSQPTSVVRAEQFLADVEKRTRRWTADSQRSAIRQHLVFTMPPASARASARSSLDESVAKCRARGNSPTEAWVASPFFDSETGTAEVTEALCKMMARGRRRDLCLCVPAVRDEASRAWRIAAPKSLLTTPARFDIEPRVEALPEKDADKNLRPWHAKMVGFRGSGYTALMVGSSNFTGAGMGVGQRWNAEANLLTIVQHKAFSRDAGQLEDVWPDMVEIEDPDRVEWLGADPNKEEEEQAGSPPVAPGFLAATYRAGDNRQIVLLLDPATLPEKWRVCAAGRDPRELVEVGAWQQSGRPARVEIPWAAPEAPEKLVVQWSGNEAFLTINVEDRGELPPPPQLDKMTSDDILGILAATDPSAAYRQWAKSQQKVGDEEDELDSAIPIDLNPLKRYDLHSTFLHRVRRRARVLAQLRANLERPVSGRQSLDWRLRGIVGIATLSDRLFREFTEVRDGADEALLTLTDFVIVLREVNYQPKDGSLKREEYEEVFQHFLKQLTRDLHQRVSENRDRVSDDLWQFWERMALKGRA